MAKSTQSTVNWQFMLQQSTAMFFVAGCIFYGFSLASDQSKEKSYDQFVAGASWVVATLCSLLNIAIELNNPCSTTVLNTPLISLTDFHSSFWSAMNDLKETIAPGNGPLLPYRPREYPVDPTQQFDKDDSESKLSDPCPA